MNTRNPKNILPAHLLFQAVAAVFSVSVFFGLNTSCEAAPWRLANSVQKAGAPPDSTVIQMVDAILSATSNTANFVLQAKDKGSVEARIAGDQRVLYYNLRYLDSLPADVLRYAVLAHAIGHHVNEHRFLPGFTTEEALAAAEFAGYALYLLDAQQALLERLPGFIPGFSPVYDGVTPLDTGEDDHQGDPWVDALKRGFSRAEASFLSASFNGYVDDGSGEMLKGVPEFPFPPGPSSATYDLTGYFKNKHTLGDVDAKLSRALRACGYYESRYFQLKGGFALITRIEQFNEDGTCRQDDSRWSAKPARKETFSLEGYLEYFRRLFFEDDTYFRVFAFIVTPELWSPDPGRVIDREEAGSWLNEGANRLPRAIADRAFTEATGVTVLIYEFKVKEANSKEIWSNPSKLQGYTHLERSRLLNQIAPD